MLHVSLQNSAPIRLNAEFDSEPGELLALVGPSGSGKTSVLRAIAGLLTSPGLKGRVQVGHAPEQLWFDSERGIRLAPQQRRVGLVFQHYALFPHLTAIENVALAAGNTSASAQFEALFERMGLAGLQHRRPAQLSGGQQQRVALARALAREPQVLLLDEPFSTVDAPTRQTLYRELAALRQRIAIPMVLVTHDLNEARRLADRVVILDAGESLQIGPPAKVFASPRNARVAELVGIQNHFQGQFFSNTEPGGFGRLVWTCQQSETGEAVSLQVTDKGRLDNGAEVSWVIAGELLDVTAEPASSSPRAVNTVECTVLEVLQLGEISLCTVAPKQLPHQRVALNLSTALLRQLAVQAGTTLYLHIPPEAVHIMPVR
jgi:molybdate transport system ATP-binding protein